MGSHQSAYGPGSQVNSADEHEMSFMQMPSGMTTFKAPTIPEPEEIVGLEDVLVLAQELLQLLKNYRIGGQRKQIDITGLENKQLTFFNQLLGEGEVSIQSRDAHQDVLIQESVLASVWRLQYIDSQGKVVKDLIEVADIPSLIIEKTFIDAQEQLDIANMVFPATIYNAAPLLTEINEKLLAGEQASSSHIINLSLLPHSEDDLLFLSQKLGIGSTIILSRGYGNCRISSSNTKNVWWVQYFNSQETLILNTIEITAIPNVACAAQEDVEDSGQRLAEILSIYTNE